MKTKKVADAVVKIDSGLLKSVEILISKEENSLKFVNKKQFIDLAVYEKLKKEGGKWQREND